jgi:hypothetical protein
MATQSLQRGLLLMCATHLAVAALRASIDKAALYPAAMACRPAVIASWIVYIVGSMGGRRTR